MSEAAERAVLGTVLMDQRALLLLSADIGPHDFHTPRLRRIWGLMLELHERGAGVDILSLCTALGSELEQVGGRAFVASLLDEATTPTNVETYARQLLDASMKRSLLRASAEIREAATSDAAGELVVDLAQRAIGDVVARRLGNATAPLHKAVRQFAVDVFHRIDGDVPVEPDLRFGFGALDELVGLTRGDLVIVGGRPSMGKTGFALALIENMARQKRGPVFFFSSEMRQAEIAMRWIAQTTGLSMQRMRRAQVSDAELEAMGRAAGEAEKLQVMVDDTPAANVHYIRNRARMLALDGKPALVVVDYLQLLRYPGVDDPRIEVTRISGALKALARELDAPVVALSQLNRSLESRADKRPQLADLRESGSIEQDADSILFLYREWVYDRRLPEDKAEIIVAKQRNGALGTVRARFVEGVWRDPEAEELPLPRARPAPTPAADLARQIERVLRRGGAMPVDDLAAELERGGWRGSTRELWSVLDAEGWGKADGYAGLD